MSSVLSYIETQHGDMVHDIQFDYYAKRIATCSSDRTIKVFECNGEKYHNSATLTGHEGPVWQVSWAHPRFGVILASCSYDGSVLIFRESSQNNWTKIYEYRSNDSSINSIAWCPNEYGLILACAASNGKVYLLKSDSNEWIVNEFENDRLGCNAVSWAPFGSLGSIDSNGSPVMMIITGSCDNLVRLWKYSESSRCWELDDKNLSKCQQHGDWVRDVAWAPNTAMPYNIFASCSEDRTVRIWKQCIEGGSWTNEDVLHFEAPVWRVSWSVTGNILAVSTGDHLVTLFKQNLNEKWEVVSSVDENSQ